MNPNTPFFDFIASNEEMSGYFNSLPKNIQETIVQSGSDIKSVGDLKNIASGLMEKS